MANNIKDNNSKNKISANINDLEFYLDNDLNEIYHDIKNNYLLVNNNNSSLPLNITNKDQQKETSSKNINSSTSIDDKNNNQKSIIDPVFSTSKALANLAQKNLKDLQSNDSKNFDQKNDMDKFVNDKFVPIDNIIIQAKKLATQAKTIEELKISVENFDGCNLKKMATNTVFANGNQNSKIMVIGEAPGNHEDLQGIPFCGDSGQMLDEMFNHIKLTRKKNLYITNVIFWRPPGNRKPLEEELLICKPFLEKHIQLLQPKIIILVGATAMEAILGISEPITKIRGQILDFHPHYLEQPIKSFAIFHPSYLMRQAIKKKIAWQDMLTLENYIKKNLGDYDIF